EDGRTLQRRVALGRTPGSREYIHAVPVAPVGGGDDEAVIRHRTETRPDVEQVGDLRALIQQRPGGAGVDTRLGRGALADDLVGLCRVFEVEHQVVVLRLEASRVQLVGEPDAGTIEERPRRVANLWNLAVQPQQRPDLEEHRGRV